MARMKFLCDAERCIECNACVTACKNENEVPWGVNRRRVVTINDGKPATARGCVGHTVALERAGREVRGGAVEVHAPAVAPGRVGQERARIEARI